MDSSTQVLLNFPYFYLIFTLHAFMIGCKCPHSMNTCFQFNGYLGSCETGKVGSRWQVVGHQWRAFHVITYLFLDSDLIHQDVSTHMAISTAQSTRM